MRWSITSQTGCLIQINMLSLVIVSISMLSLKIKCVYMCLHRKDYHSNLVKIIIKNNYVDGYK